VVITKADKSLKCTDSMVSARLCDSMNFVLLAVVTAICGCSYACFDFLYIANSNLLTLPVVCELGPELSSDIIF